MTECPAVCFCLAMFSVFEQSKLYLDIWKPEGLHLRPVLAWHGCRGLHCLCLRLAVPVLEIGGGGGGGNLGSQAVS